MENALQGLATHTGTNGPPALFAPIDLHFARLMGRLSRGEVDESFREGSAGRDWSDAVFLASALVSSHTRQGHICIDLAEHAGRVLGDRASGLYLECPPLDEWKRALAASSVVGAPGDYRPLILDGESRLYLWRYWSNEHILADKLLALSRREIPLDAGRARQRIDLHFSGSGHGTIDWQKVAVLMGLKAGLCIITGGPGTGKTTVVTRLLAVLAHLDPGVRVALAAPTGKAAQRLEESLGRTLASLEAKGAAPVVPDLKACTIHRLLGVVPGRESARHSPDNPLPHDVVVVDEASMASLGLMCRLVQALKPSARLVLVGDRHQLASVEPGHVLGDICETGGARAYSVRTCSLAREVTGCSLPEGSPTDVQDCLVELTDTYRFGAGSGIRRLSEAVRTGDSDACFEMARAQGFPDVTFSGVTSPSDVRDLLEREAFEGYSPCLGKQAPAEIFEFYAGFRVLCALREGPFGVVAVNRLIERILSERGLIRPDRQHYHGRPILVTENDYGAQLFNGDTGFILRDAEDGELRAFFPGAGGTVRRMSVVRLPKHETAFAMTVHKSQGSEFARVVLILPPQDSPVLTRELVYTGITRASEHLHLCMSAQTLRTAVHRRTERVSGLGGLLRARQ